MRLIRGLLGGHQADVSAVKAGLHQSGDGLFGILHVVVQSNNCFHYRFSFLLLDHVSEDEPKASHHQ